MKIYFGLVVWLLPVTVSVYMSFGSVLVYVWIDTWVSTGFGNFLAFIPFHCLLLLLLSSVSLLFACLLMFLSLWNGIVCEVCCFLAVFVGLILGLVLLISWLLFVDVLGAVFWFKSSDPRRLGNCCWLNFPVQVFVVCCCFTKPFLFPPDVPVGPVFKKTDIPACVLVDYNLDCSLLPNIAMALGHFLIINFCLAKNQNWVFRLHVLRTGKMVSVLIYLITVSDMRILCNGIIWWLWIGMGLRWYDYLIVNYDYLIMGNSSLTRSLLNELEYEPAFKHCCHLQHKLLSRFLVI